MRALPLLLVAACSYKPTVNELATGDGPATDGPAVLEDTGDAPPDSVIGPTPTACVAKWLAGTMTFTSIVVLRSDASSLFTTAEERDPYLSSNELTLFFAKPGVGGDTDVFTTTRANLAANFAAPVASTLSDITAGDSKVAMTGDDLTVIVASERAGGVGLTDLWQATRTSTGVLFPILDQTFLANVNNTDHQLDPHLSKDGRRLYYAESAPPQKLMFSERANTSTAFETPVAIPVLDDPAGGADPTLTGDERVILFSSPRAGGEGGTDIWYAVRAERDQPFSAPKPLAEINSNENDGDPYITPDGCHLYFASNQTVGGDDLDLLFAEVE